jgi:hypothetical protein
VRFGGDLTLEQILTGEGFGEAMRASPLQIAICRAAQGVPLDIVGHALGRIGRGASHRARSASEAAARSGLTSGREDC